MKVTLSVDDRIVVRARSKAAALGKSLNQLVREYLERLACGDDPERDVEELKRLSSSGNRSRAKRVPRDELHRRS